MNSAFDKAKESLIIKSVNLRNSYIALNDDIEPFELKEKDTEIQSFRGVEKVKELSIQSEEEDYWEYNFFYAVGVRVIEEMDNENEVNLFLEIKACFNALYRANEKLDVEVIKAFSKQNVGYHVWPYWREFVQSSCTRLNVSPLEIPFYFCKQES